MIKYFAACRSEISSKEVFVTSMFWESNLLHQVWSSLRVNQSFLFPSSYSIINLWFSQKIRIKYWLKYWIFSRTTDANWLQPLVFVQDNLFVNHFSDSSRTPSIFFLMMMVIKWKQIFYANIFPVKAIPQKTAKN